MTPPLGDSRRVAPVNGAAADAAVFGVRLETPSHELEAERQRLQAQIAATHTRIMAARKRADRRDAEIGALLHADLVASQEYIAEMERQHDRAVAAIRAAVEAEIATIRNPGGR